jgi:putative nucleotidyltransferase with HDIG domain
MRAHPDGAHTEPGEGRGAGWAAPRPHGGLRETLANASKRWPRGYRAILFGVVFLAGLALLPRQAGYTHTEYRLGMVLAKPVIAEFDFAVLKDPLELRREQEAAVAVVPPVLALSDSVAVEAYAALDRFERSVEALRRDPHAGRVLEGSGIALSESAYAVLLSQGTAPIFAAVRERLAACFEAGVLDPLLEARLRGTERVALIVRGADWVGPTYRFATTTELRELRERASGASERTVAELVERFARPNVAWDERATEERRELARDAVAPSAEKIVKGEAILAAHKRIFPEDLLRLESYEHWREQRAANILGRERALGIIGRVLLLALSLSVLVFFLASYRPWVVADRRDLLLLTSVAALALLLGAIVLNVLHLSPYLIPLSAFGVLLALLFDEPLALASCAMLTITIGLVGDAGLEFMGIVGLGSLAAIRSVRGLQDRRQLYRLLFFVPLVHLVGLGALGLLRATPIETLLADGLYLVANPFIAAGIALFAVPVTEVVFEKHTNLALLELLDLNRPMLRRLMLEAPGTYHHSLMVGTLAEAGAASIGANALLARVIGYYHDIGKLQKPNYFIENRVAGRRNPHDRLTPTMSCLILEAHVRDGVALAKASRLPRVVREGIEQHHATGLMTFFFHKARQRDPHAPETEYRYPGPRPSSREAAILLLADQIDAASRSLEDPTPSRLRGVVSQVIEKRTLEGELDESQLTLRDLAALRESFVPILTALFRGRASGRIVYPRLEHARAHPAGGSAAEPATKLEN